MKTTQTAQSLKIKAIRARIQAELNQKLIQKAVDNPLPTW